MARGWRSRHDLEMEIVAWHASLIRNVHLQKKDRMTYKQLLGKEKKQSPIDINHNINKAWEMVKVKEGK